MGCNCLTSHYGTTRLTCQQRRLGSVIYRAAAAVCDNLVEYKCDNLGSQTKAEPTGSGCLEANYVRAALAIELKSRPEAFTCWLRAIIDVHCDKLLSSAVGPTKRLLGPLRFDNNHKSENAGFRAAIAALVDS